MQTEDFPTEKVYCPSWFTRTFALIFPLFGIAFLSLGFLSLAYDGLSASLNTIFIGIFFFGLMIIVYIAVNKAHLVLADDGITCCALGYRIYTPWQNVIGMTRKSFSSKFPARLRKFPVLQLRQPSVLAMRVVEGKQKGIAVLEVDWLPLVPSVSRYVDIVPLSMMLHGRNWKESALTRDIQQHAPWIVIDEGAI